MANLKTKETRKLSTPNFPKNEHFLPPDTHVFFCKKTNGAINYFVKKLVCVSGSKKCSLFEKSCVLCFFVNLRFKISPFALSPNIMIFIRNAFFSNTAMKPPQYKKFTYTDT